jgi:hypothetical protein
MRTYKLIPRPLRYVAGAILVLVLVLLLWAGLSAQGRSGYEFVKDVVIPLVSPIVAILVPTVLFYVIPLSQNQQKGALDLFTAFCSEEMRHARNEAWVHFVIERRHLPPLEQQQRLDDFLRHLFERDGLGAVEPEIHEIYQKTLKVLDFFAIINACLRKKTADKGMVRSFLTVYYLWWRDSILDPLRSRPFPAAGISRYKPAWWEPMRFLDEVCQPEMAGASVQ